MQYVKQQLLQQMGIKIYKLKPNIQRLLIADRMAKCKTLVVADGNDKLNSAGQNLFANILLAIKIKRDNVSFCYINLHQDHHEINLEKSIVDNSPDLILLFEGKSIRNQLDETKLVCKKITENNYFVIAREKKIPLVVILHPNELIKNPQKKAKVWRDLQHVWF